MTFSKLPETVSSTHDASHRLTTPMSIVCVFALLANADISVAATP